jgi:hypothetical protein
MVGVRGQYRLGAFAQKRASHIDPCSSFETGEMSSGDAFEWRQQVHSLFVRNAGGGRFFVVAQGGPVTVRIARHAASRQATAAYALYGRPENRRFSICVPEKLVPNVRTAIQLGGLINWYVEDDQPKYNIRLDREKAALNGITGQDAVRTASGERRRFRRPASRLRGKRRAYYGTPCAGLALRS